MPIKPTHTPTPWRVCDEFILAGGEGRGGKVIAMNHDRVHYEAESQNLADAEYIVQACNTHTELLMCMAALQQIVAWADAGCDPSEKAMTNARIALKLATEKVVRP